jgi:GT2 family glycosyltransferase
MKEKIVIQILTYNAAEKVRRCLKSLEWVKDEPNIWLVVLDNASAEPVPQIIKNEFPFVECVVNNMNTGFANGHNKALEYSLKHEPDYLLILNPDAVITKDDVTILAGKLNCDETIGLAAPLIKNEAGNIEKSINIHLTILHYILKIFSISLIDIKTKGLYKKDNFVEAVSGACMFIRRKVIEKTGLFDPDFFFYVEDTEFCYRVIKAGWKILFTPEAEIVHSLSSSTESHADAQNWRKTQLYLSTFIYFKKRRNGFELTLLKYIRMLEMRFRIAAGLKRGWAKEMLAEIKKL